MTTHESRRATLEARRTVSSSTAPVSRYEAAMLHYLNATAQLSPPINHGQGRPAAEPVVHGADDPAPAAAGTRTTNKEGRRSDLVVVGIDGSGCALHAARWAAVEAVRRQGALRLIHAYSLAPAGYPGYNPYPAILLTQLRDEGADLLAGTADALRRDYPALEISIQLVHGEKATVLRHSSGDAALLVVGAHEQNRVALTPNSVPGDIAGVNPVPVAVIRGGDEHPDGPVVVGVDGSPASEAAIAFAFEAAALRGACLVAVHAWTDPALVDPVPLYSAAVFDPQPIADHKRIQLTERLACWADKYPDVTVQRVLAHDRPIPALLKYAGTAQLIVVGTRGRGRLASVLLGSTSRALINRADCPIVLTRPHSAG